MLFLAIKNLLRYRRKSFLIFFMLFGTTFMLTVSRLILSGIERETLNNFIQQKTGYLQIQTAEWHEEPILENIIEVTPELLTILKENNILISPRIMGGALLSYKEQSKFISIFSANFEKEQTVTNLHKIISKGILPSSTLSSHNKEVAITNQLAQRLELLLHDKISIVTNQLDGSLYALNLQIVGIIQNDLNLFNDTIFTNLQVGEQLFGLQTQQNSIIDPRFSIELPSEFKTSNIFDEHQLQNHTNKKYSSLVIIANNLEHAQKIKDLITNKIPLYSKEQLTTNFSPYLFDWEQLNPSILQYLSFVKIGDEIWYYFLIILMSYGILSTMQLSYQERKHELGILWSLGTTIPQIQYLIYMEFLLIFVPAFCIGFITSIATSFWLESNPIPLSFQSLDQVIKSTGIVLVLTTKTEFSSLLYSLISIGTPPLVLLYFITKRITKFNPIEILQK